MCKGCGRHDRGRDEEVSKVEVTEKVGVTRVWARKIVACPLVEVDSGGGGGDDKWQFSVLSSLSI